MAFVNLAVYAAKVNTFTKRKGKIRFQKGVTRQNIIDKIHRGLFKKEDIRYIPEVNRYLINENTTWPRLLGGKPKKIKETKETK